ncbi:MAG: hypothetical protein ACREDM_08075 [Methylocella sp.]
MNSKQSPLGLTMLPEMGATACELATSDGRRNIRILEQVLLLVEILFGCKHGTL